MENSVYKYFLLTIGSVQIIMALMEVISPLRSFLMWKRWVSGSFFPFHGIALIFIGLPMTFFKGYLSSIIFYIGLFIVFTGPFIIIYPEKIRKVFNNSEDVFSDKDVKIMIFLDAFFRLSIGVIFLISFRKTFFQ